MKNIFFIIISFSIILLGCKQTATEQTQEQQSEQQTVQQNEPKENEQSSLTARGTILFNDVLKEVVKALKNNDLDILNKYIDTETGLYYIISTQGIYSEIITYTDFQKVFQDSETTSEYEQNSLSYLLDYLNNVEIEELEIINQDLLGEEPCDFTEKGFFKDKSEANSKSLTDIYNMNLERDGLKIDPNKLLELGEIQNRAKQRFLINDGEATYTLYFSKENGQFKLLMMDMRECSI